MDIPIGIINTSWGGTRVEAWTSPKKLNELGPTNHINHQEKYRFDDKIRYNDSIVLINQKNFGFKMVEFPIYREEVEKKWDEYDFKDQNFSEVDYNDDQWNKIDLNPNFENHLFF